MKITTARSELDPATSVNDQGWGTERTVPKPQQKDPQAA
jgi:hypothetical protein